MYMNSKKPCIYNYIYICGCVKNNMSICVKPNHLQRLFLPNLHHDGRQQPVQGASHGTTADIGLIWTAIHSKDDTNLHHRKKPPITGLDRIRRLRYMNLFDPCPWGRNKTILLKRGKTFLHMFKYTRRERSDLTAAPTIHASSTPGLGPNNGG